MLTVPFILKPVRSFVRKFRRANGTNIGVHKHSPVLENTNKEKIKFLNYFLKSLKNYLHSHQKHKGQTKAPEKIRKKNSFHLKIIFSALTKASFWVSATVK